MIKLPPISENPLVSIIVPSFNQGRFIKQTLDSVLGQDYRPLEVIVVDGASTDNTLDILREYDEVTEVKWISEKDNGPVDAVNKGFLLATGVYCAIQSTDDCYLPGAIKFAIDVLKDEPELGLVYGDYIKIDEDSNEIARYRFPQFTLKRFLSLQTIIVQPTVFFRLALAKDLGGWDDRFPYVPDTDLWMRIAFRAKVHKIDRFQACARAHAAQRDQQRQLILENYLRMIETSKDLANARLCERRAARAGACKIRIRYGEKLTDGEMTRLYWEAAMCYPPILLSENVPWHRLVPGYFAITERAAKVRRWMKENLVS